MTALPSRPRVGVVDVGWRGNNLETCRGKNIETCRWVKFYNPNRDRESFEGSFYVQGLRPFWESFCFLILYKGVLGRASGAPSIQ